MVFVVKQLLQWKEGFKVATPWVSYWLVGLGTSIFVHVGALAKEKQYKQMLPFAGLPIVTYLMAKAGEKYQGMVKAMGLPHGIGFILLLSHTAYHLFFKPDKLTFKSHPYSFGTGCWFLFLNGIGALFDVFDVYVWYVKKTRVVIRDNITLENLKKQGKLKQDVGNKQTVMVNGVIIGDTDEFGFSS